jgi:hypothetical protein
MDKDSSKAPDEQALFAGEAWFDPGATHEIPLAGELPNQG